MKTDVLHLNKDESKLSITLSASCVLISRVPLENQQYDKLITKINKTAMLICRGCTSH